MQTRQCCNASDGGTVYFSCLLRAIGLGVDFYLVYLFLLLFLPVSYKTWTQMIYIQSLKVKSITKKYFRKT